MLSKFSGHKPRCIASHHKKSWPRSRSLSHLADPYSKPPLTTRFPGLPPPCACWRTRRRLPGNIFPDPPAPLSAQKPSPLGPPQPWAVAAPAPPVGATHIIPRSPNCSALFSVKNNMCEIEAKVHTALSGEGSHIRWTYAPMSWGMSRLIPAL